MGDSIRAYYDDLADHEYKEEQTAKPLLKALDGVGVDRITLGDLRVLLTLTPDTHRERLIIKQLHEKYIGPVQWKPKADII